MLISPQFVSVPNFSVNCIVFSFIQNFFGSSSFEKTGQFAWFLMKNCIIKKRLLNVESMKVYRVSRPMSSRVIFK